MSSIQDIFGASPKSVLNKPFMHVQEQQPQLTDAGASAAGDNDRNLNTVLHNDISGASLSGGEVTLPAGQYYIEGSAPAMRTQRHQLKLYDSADNEILRGTIEYQDDNTTYGGQSRSFVNGVITLASATAIKLTHFTQDAEGGNGLGISTSSGVAVFSDLRIWKTDSTIDTVVLSDPSLTLARPLMHVQDQKTSGTSGGTSVLGDNHRDLNTVLTNDITGASLSSNAVTLPAGKYYIEAFTTARFDAAGTARLKINDGTSDILIGNTAENYATNVTEHPFVNGQITLTQATTITLQMYHFKAYSNGLGYAANAPDGDVEIYTDLRIWRLDALKTIESYGDSELTLARPLMHVQHEETLGTHGGTSSVGWTDRPLNTVKTNEITGASLSSNEVTLPAGTYLINASCLVHDTSIVGYEVAILDASDDSVLIDGPYTNGLAGTVNKLEIEPARLVLTETTAIKLASYSTGGEANTGLGYAASIGLTEVYASMQIWQIDAVRPTPVLLNDRLYPLPGNTFVTGNMYGLEYSYNSANSVDVAAGICMDSTNNVILSLSSSVNVSIGTSINTIYNLFICKHGTTGAISIQTDTDINGANLAATYSNFRWIGFVLTDSSGDIIRFHQDTDVLTFKGGVIVYAPTLPTTHTQLDLSSWIPTTRVSRVFLNSTAITENPIILVSIDGTNDATRNDNGTLIDFKSGWYFRAYSASYDNATLLLYNVKLKR